MPARPKQRHISCFLEIVRQGSIAMAAESLSVTQPAVSRTLADLEAILQARLLERSRAGVSLTPAGEVFLRFAMASASALDKGITSVAQIRQDSRQAVHIGMLPTVAVSLLPRATKQFKSNRAEVPVHIATGTNQALSDSLRRGELDFVVGRLGAAEEMTGLIFDPVYQEEIVAVVRKDHPLLSTKKPSDIGKQLGDYTIILPLKTTILRDGAEQLLMSLGLGYLPNTIETVSGEFGLTYLEDSSAVWIAPKGIVRRAIDANILEELPLDYTATRANIGITTRADLKLSALSAEFVKLIKRLGAEDQAAAAVNALQ